MAKIVQYAGNNAGNGPSMGIWADCPVLEMIEDPNKGYYFFDDFLNHPAHTSDQSTQTYDSYVDNNAEALARLGVAAPLTPGGGVGGVITVANNGTANDEFVMSQYGAPWVITDDTDATAAPIAKKLWFECRIALESVTDGDMGFFVGLASDFGSSVTVAKTACLADTTAALGDFSFLGFHQDAADGDAIDAVYKAEGQTAQVSIAGAQASAVDTWYKLGFKYDPDENTARRIKWYVNGVEKGTYVTGTNIAAATFPDLEPLALVLCTKAIDGSAHEFYMDWWRCAQLR